MSVSKLHNTLPHWQERVDLAAAFRWTARLNMHEAVANHFSMAINGDGTRFLMNPNQMHFARIRASDLIEVDVNDADALSGPDAPDPTAWGLHGGVHRHCAHARCVMHVHSIFATVLASLADSRLPPVDQNCATFFNRYVIDDGYSGLAFEAEGARCAGLLSDPKVKVMIMGNHGVLIIGDTVAETFNRMFYFERA
ncbi:MAG: class II aldolase/adducin family protein, partial [Rhodobacteraceae bacterium]|nr:class II aldolase/adducin family protein [Paracoccaceae bacterium]